MGVEVPATRIRLFQQPKSLTANGFNDFTSAIMINDQPVQSLIA
jgi:hypothetical protein